jgi:NAD-dependent dihydropyrimidine dehydrogenase PreA subunit
MHEPVAMELSPRWATPGEQRVRPAARYLKQPTRFRRFWQLLRELPLNLFLYVFRAAPYPVRPGLMIMGNPDRRSPVLITTNYELTVRRVARALVNVDCYVLVAPAGGINVWCAAGDGHFSIDSIVSIIKTSRIEEVVDHRRLVLPELCANGINMFDVKERTGWTAVFGPARIEDVPPYLQRGEKKTHEMLRVTFTGVERLEMSLAMWGSLTLRYSLFPFLIFGAIETLWFAALLALLSLVVTFGCTVLPGKTFVQKAGIVGLPLLTGILGGAAFSGWLTASFVATWALLVLGASFVVGAAFPGYSPYWQCGYSKLFFGAPDLELKVIEEGCIGCKICDEVCPVECFAATDHQTYELINPDLCEGCMACVINCPTDTIVNEVAQQHRLETALG